MNNAPLLSRFSSAQLLTLHHDGVRHTFGMDSAVEFFTYRAGDPLPVSAGFANGGKATERFTNHTGPHRNDDTESLSIIYGLMLELRRPRAPELYLSPAMEDWIDDYDRMAAADPAQAAAREIARHGPRAASDYERWLQGAVEHQSGFVFSFSESPEAFIVSSHAVLQACRQDRGSFYPLPVPVMTMGLTIRLRINPVVVSQDHTSPLAPYAVPVKLTLLGTHLDIPEFICPGYVIDDTDREKVIATLRRPS